MLLKRIKQLFVFQMTFYHYIHRYTYYYIKRKIDINVILMQTCGFVNKNEVTKS